MKPKNTEIQEIKQEIVSVPMTAETLIAQAIDKNIPVETMAKLLDMRRELRAEQSKEAYDRAMAKFQSKCPAIDKGSKAGFGNFTYNYAPLEYIVDKVKGLLAENGFSYTFDTKQGDSKIKIICKVKHSLGHMEESEVEMEIDRSGKMNVSQQYGSAITYGKRYSFCNAFGINVGGEDNDGHYATNAEKTVSRPTVTPQNTQEIQSTQNRVVSSEEEPATSVEKSRVAALVKANKVQMEFSEVNKLTHARAEQILQAN